MVDAAEFLHFSDDEAENRRILREELGLKERVPQREGGRCKPSYTRIERHPRASGGKRREPEYCRTACLPLPGRRYDRTGMSAGDRPNSGGNTEFFRPEPIGSGRFSSLSKRIRGSGRSACGTSFADSHVYLFIYTLARSELSHQIFPLWSRTMLSAMARPRP